MPPFKTRAACSLCSWRSHTWAIKNYYKAEAHVKETTHPVKITPDGAPEAYTWINPPVLNTLEDPESPEF